MIFFLVTSLVFLFFPNANAFPPVFSVESSDFLTTSMYQNQIINESHHRWVMKSSGSSVDSSDLYLVNDAKGLMTQELLSQWGTVFEFHSGKFALWKPFLPAHVSLLSEWMHEKGLGCGGVEKLRDIPMKFTNHTFENFDSTNISVQKNYLVNQINIQKILNDIQTMTSWKTRYHKHPEGKKAGEKVKILFDSMIPENRNDVSVKLVSHRGSPQKSVIVRIEGTDSPDEVIILGSHLDSISRGRHNMAPGADDDASGTATNLEIFRVLMENNIHLGRTLEIQAYAAEEIGLVGSGEIADSYADQNINVVAMIQFDMNGYSKNKKPHIYLISNKTNRSLTRRLKDIGKAYLDIPIKEQMLFLGSSDHASFNRVGYPVAFPTENPWAFNRKIHTPEDTIDLLNAPEQMTSFAKLGLAFLLEDGPRTSVSEQ